jgi:hypothetical protein
MSTDRETTRLVRSWLEEGVTALPDRVLDSVLDQLPATRQRRSWWPSGWLAPTRSVSPMVAAAAVVVIMLIGFILVPVWGPGGPVTPTPTTVVPTPEPNPTAAPLETPISPGIQSLGGYPVGISFTVPAGWFWCSISQLEQGVCRVGGSSTELRFLIVNNVVADPCGDALLDPPPGPSVDDLVAAISGLANFTASVPIEITVGGLAGKEFTVTAPIPACSTLRTWATADRTNGVSAGEANLIRIVDVDGTRVVITGAYLPLESDATEAIAGIREVMDSVTFNP